MPPKDWIEQNKAVEAAKAEILAAIAATNGKLDIGVIANTVKSIQTIYIKQNSSTVGSTRDDLTGGWYRDYKIAEVNPEKVSVSVRGHYYGSTGYRTSARIVDSTTVRHIQAFNANSGVQDSIIEIVEYY